MKKPLNNFALFLALLSIAYAVLAGPEILEVFRQPSAINSASSANYVHSFAVRDILAILHSTIYGSGVLLGLAVIVELLDRSIWEARKRQS